MFVLLDMAYQTLLKYFNIRIQQFHIALNYMGLKIDLVDSYFSLLGIYRINLYQSD